jgi:cell division protein FtsL
MNQKSNNKLNIILIATVLILVVVQIIVSSSLVAEGKKLQAIKTEISALEEENNVLKTKIANLSTLTKLSLVAEEKGFIKNPPVLNLSSKVPVAVKTN